MEDKEYFSMSAEALYHYMRTFASPEEMFDFARDVSLNSSFCIEAADKAMKKIRQGLTGEDVLPDIARIILTFGFFCRKNMDVIQELVRRLDIKPVGASEKDEESHFTFPE